jgi:hypothetical protein
VSIWIAFALIGSMVGWWIHRDISIQADKQKKYIKLPASHATLISILLIFFFRYYFGYFHIVDPASLKNPFFIYPDLIISAIITGFILGRGLCYSYIYVKSPHTNLSKH